jgi:hypothetical protein
MTAAARQADMAPFGAFGDEAPALSPVVPQADSQAGAPGGGANERADVARRALELSETIAEAIGYMVCGLESSPGDISAYGVMLKDAGEGMLSLKNAVSAISEKSGLDPDDVRKLDWAYDELSERIEEMADAYLDDRAADFALLGAMLQETFISYRAHLSDCCRGISIM